MKHLFVGFLLLFAFYLAKGQQADTIVLDSVGVTEQFEEDGEVSPPEEDYEEGDPPEPLFLPKDSMDKLRRNPDYGYMKNLDSILRNLEANAPEPEEPSAPSKSIFDIAFVKLIVWGLAIFAVLYIL
jgi:hypothetical protein